MPGSGFGVGVIVVAIFEIGSLVEKQAEAPAFEIPTIAIEVVGSKLIDDKNNDQLRMAIVSTSPRRRHGRNNEGRKNQESNERSELRHGDGSSIANIGAAGARVANSV